MKIKRTANAGVLLTISGETFLLDGVCGEVYPYIKTPQHIREEIEKSYPDNVLFTHYHDDHYDKAFAKDPMKMNGMSVFGKYLSKMKLKQWKDYSWADTERL